LLRNSSMHIHMQLRLHAHAAAAADTEDEESSITHSTHVAKEEGRLHEAGHTCLELKVVDAVPEHKHARRSARHRIRQSRIAAQTRIHRDIEAQRQGDACKYTHIFALRNAESVRTPCKHPKSCLLALMSYTAFCGLSFSPAIQDAAPPPTVVLN
jgi:hypothetical protein